MRITWSSTIERTRPRQLRTAMPQSDALSAYVSGTKAWFPDQVQGWISATQSKDAEVGDGRVKLVFTVDDSGDERVVEATLEQVEKDPNALPPLRNPPLLEATDDLTNLSHLNEASVLLSLIHI